MKTFFALILIEVLSPKIFAQDPRLIDSLQQIIDVAKTDTIKVQSLNALAWAIKAIKPDTAIKHAQHALNICQTNLQNNLPPISDSTTFNAFRKAKGRAYLSIGTANFYKGSYGDALTNDSLAENVFREINDKKNLANTLMNIGNVWGAKNDQKKNLQLQLDAKKIREEINDKKGLSLSYTNIGTIYLNRSEYAAALEYDKKALALSKELNDQYGMAYAYQNTGLAFQSLGKSDSAYISFRQAVAQFESLKDRNGIFETNKKLASFFSSIGSLDSSIAYYEKTIAFANETGNKIEQAGNYNNIGLVYNKMGNYSRGLSYFIDASQIYEAANDSFGIATCLLDFGMIDYYQGKYESGISKLQKAYSIYEKLDNKNGMVYCLSNIGLDYSKLSKYKESLDYLSRALQIHRDKGNRSMEGSTLISMGMSYSGVGADSSAIKCYKEALEIQEDIGDKGRAAISSSNLGIVLNRQKKFDESIPYLTKALALARETFSMEWIKETSLELSEAMAGIDNYKDAYENYRTFHLYSDSIINEVNGKQMAELQTKFETEKKDKEITLLNKENNIQSLTLKEQQSKLREEKLISEQRKNQIELLNQSQEIEALILNKKENELHEQKLQTETKSKEVEILNKDKEISNAQLSIQKTIRNYSLAALGLAVVIALLLFNQYRVTQKSKQLLEEKNKIIGKEKLFAEEMRERAEESERFKARFLANMSHEIRTPMNAVMGMTNLLLKTKLEQQQYKYLDAVQKSSRNLLVIINDILDLSKIEAGKMELEKIDFRLSEALDTVYNTLRFKAEEKGLNFVVDIDSSITPVLIGDPVRLNQILINLTGNAIKFTEKGNIKIHAQLELANHLEQKIIFTVSDTGIGIPENKINTVFEGFQQADKSTFRKFGGTGLGLNISKQLTEMSGGVITVQSKLGVGTTFFVNIPFGIGSEKAIEEKSKPIDQSIISRLGRLKILLAEDNEFNQIVAVDTLKMVIPGITVDVANNGKEAIEMIRHNKYDLVLMDVNMPEMNGLEATQSIRKDFPSPINKLKIIAMTASITKNEIDLCYQSGMDDYVPKPFEQDELIEKIAKLTPQ
ncbi:MAG: tetratricopeptide repeat protein [Bacteroidota bacterium]